MAVTSMAANVCRTGLTHVRWSRDDARVYAAGRNSDVFACYDVRYMREPLFQVARDVTTNQRIYYDVMPHDAAAMESTLASGSTGGTVSFYDVIDQGECDNYLSGERSVTFKAHDSCANGCEFNPCMPLLVTSSGQRRVVGYSSDTSSSSSDDSEGETAPIAKRQKMMAAGVTSQREHAPRQQQQVEEDNSLKVWMLSLV